VQGGTYPARIWGAFMRPALYAQPVEDWAPPPAPTRTPARLYLPGEECAQAELPEREAALAQAAEVLQSVHDQLDAEVAELQSQRAAAAGTLTEAEVALYERVRHQFHGVGVARLEGGHCSGCHMELSARELDIVKAVPAGELAECPQCGRIIVR
jgi:predicted  nucleic acid-binding Zn-ribbon protein